jgi:hypothetical protein
VQHVHVIVGRGQVIGHVAGPVRGVVVGDQDVGLGHGLADPAGDLLDVRRLVVRGDDHQDPAQLGGDPLGRWPLRH